MAPAKLRSGAKKAHLSAIETAEKTATPEQPRVLRVGVVKAGRVVDEKLFTPGASVTVGGSERNDFVLTDEGLPSRFKMFEHRGGRYYLAIADFMEGRVSTREGFDDISSLRQRREPSGASRKVRVVLADDARGKVVVGDTTLLFQLVRRPATAPLPKLPASVRAGWVKNIDWFFSAMLVASFVGQFTFVLWLVFTDWPIQPSFDVHSDVIRDLFNTPPSQVEIQAMQERLSQQDPAPEESVPLPGAAESAGSDEGPSHPSRTRRTTGPTRDGDELDADAQRRLRAALEQSAREALGRINIIGSNNPNADGAVADVLAGGGVQQDQDRILAEITGVRVASRDDESVLRRPGGCQGNCGNVADVGALIRQDPADRALGTGEVDERRIRGDSRSGPVSVSPTSQGDLDPATVRRVVASNMGGITSCYERPLQRDHSLAGRVTINFTIGEGGRVLRASAVQNTVAPEVGSCIERRIRSLRFPSPQGGPATFQFPFIFQPAAH